MPPLPCSLLQVAPWEYDLVLQPDINTRGHTQWFFFAVSNMRPGRRYSFNIINLLKEDSLYNMGMLPLLHSEQQMGRKVCARERRWRGCLCVRACRPAAISRLTDPYTGVGDCKTDTKHSLSGTCPCVLIWTACWLPL